MKPRLPLSTKILLLAAANLALLAVAGAVFARFELGYRFDSRLVGAARERVRSIARDFQVDLEESEVKDRDGLVARYAKGYGVDFYLFEAGEQQLAGPVVKVPAAVREELIKPPPRAVGPPRHREDDDDDDGKKGDDKKGDDKKGADRDHQGPPIFETSAEGRYWVGIGIPLRARDQEFQKPGVLLMSTPSFFSTALFFNYKQWLGLVAAVAAVFVICWLPFIRGMTRMVKELSEATGRIAEGDFEQHVPEDRSDELGLLAGGINRMASRLSSHVKGQKRFLGDIAHELCAPIARIQFALGVLEHKTEPGTVDDLQDEVRQMSSLVAELLSFSKSSIESKAKPLVAVNLADAAREAVVREGAESKVEWDISQDLQALADRDSLIRALGNLIRNAIRYAGDAGPIAIGGREEQGSVLITVGDYGPGLPLDELDRVFAPFYRIEASRSREHGGVGLGLAIVKNCVDACKGSVQCRNRVPHGLEVEIRLEPVRQP